MASAPARHASPEGHEPLSHPKQRVTALLATLTAMVLALFQQVEAAAFPPGSRRAALAQRRNQFARDEGGFANIIDMALIGSLLTLIVGLLILAAFAVPYFNSSDTVVSSVSDPNVTTGNADADALKPVFGFVIAVVLLLAFVTAILAFAKFRTS